MATRTISDKRLAANRSNARKSTGPKSVEGKIASSQNAIRHGMSARPAVLPRESAKEYEELRQSLRQAHQPRPGMEELLVERMVALSWKLRRSVEASGKLARLQHADRWADRAGTIETIVSFSLAEPPPDKPRRWSGARILAQQCRRKEPGSFLRLERYEAAVESRLLSVCRQLLRFQQLRGANKHRDPPQDWIDEAPFTESDVTEAPVTAGPLNEPEKTPVSERLREDPDEGVAISAPNQDLGALPQSSNVDRCDTRLAQNEPTESTPSVTGNAAQESTEKGLLNADDSAGAVASFARKDLSGRAIECLIADEIVGRSRRSDGKTKCTTEPTEFTENEERKRAIGNSSAPATLPADSP